MHRRRPRLSSHRPPRSSGAARSLAIGRLRVPQSTSRALSGCGAALVSQSVCVMGAPRYVLTASADCSPQRGWCQLAADVSVLLAAPSAERRAFGHLCLRLSGRSALVQRLWRRSSARRRPTSRNDGREWCSVGRARGAAAALRDNHRHGASARSSNLERRLHGSLAAEPGARGDCRR